RASEGGARLLRVTPGGGAGRAVCGGDTLTGGWGDAAGSGTCERALRFCRSSSLFCKTNGRSLDWGSAVAPGWKQPPTISTAHTPNTRLHRVIGEPRRGDGTIHRNAEPVGNALCGVPFGQGTARRPFPTGVDWDDPSRRDYSGRSLKRKTC